MDRANKAYQKALHCAIKFVDQTTERRLVFCIYAIILHGKSRHIPILILPVTLKRERA